MELSQCQHVPVQCSDDQRQYISLSRDDECVYNNIYRQSVTAIQKDASVTKMHSI